MIFKAGLIGFGYWGPVLLRNFSAHKDIEIEAICDRNSSKLNTAQSLSPKSKTYKDADFIFSDPTIDFVIIATQAETHYDLIRKSLLSGKHVFVEKPFTLNSIQAEELVSKNRELNLLIMVDHTFLFTPQYEAIKKIICANRLGKLLHFHSLRADFGLFQKDINILWHLMYHDIYILMDLFEQLIPISIKASGSAHIVGPLEDTAMVSIKYPNGLNADIINNMLFPRKERKIIIAGEKAILLWDDTVPEHQKLSLFNKNASYDKETGKIEYSSGDSFEIVEVSKKQALENQVDCFVSCLKKDQKPENNEISALQVIKFLENIQKVMHD